MCSFEDPKLALEMVWNVHIHYKINFNGFLGKFNLTSTLGRGPFIHSYPSIFTLGIGVGEVGVVINIKITNN